MMNHYADELGSDRPKVSLGEVMTLQRGFDLPRNKRLKGPFPVIASTGQVGFHAEAKVRGPGVVIGRSGSLGGGQYIKDDFWPLNTTLWVKDFKGNDRHFCYYLLKSLDLAHFNAGSGVPTLNRNHIHPLPVLCPSLPEQRAIVHILGTLDDKIELNRRMNETLEEMARALFKSWFVDFEPVRAKMEGRWRGGQSLPGMPAELYDLFPDGMVSSELGEIPEGWEVSEIGREVDVVGGSTPSTKEPAFWEKGDVHWATPKDLSNLQSNVLLGTERKITSAGLKKISSGLLPAGTVLMSSRAPVGYLAIAQVPLAVNQGFIAMECNKRISRAYVLFWCEANMDIIKANASGTTFAEISKRNFRPLKIIAPAARVLKVFDGIVNPLLARITLNELESHSLAGLRDGLLPRLLSGKMRVVAPLHRARKTAPCR